MEKDKLYKEPELTLKILADKLQVPTYLLSQVINYGMKKNFLRPGEWLSCGRSKKITYR